MSWIPNAGELEYWRRTGVLQSPHIFSSAEVFGLRAHVDDIISETAAQFLMRDPLLLEKDKGLLMIDNAHWSSSILRSVCTDVRLGRAAAILLGTPSPTSATRAKKIGKLLILRSRIFKGRHYTLDFWVRW